MLTLTNVSTTYADRAEVESVVNALNADAQRDPAAERASYAVADGFRAGFRIAVFEADGTFVFYL